MPPRPGFRRESAAPVRVPPGVTPDSFSSPHIGLSPEDNMRNQAREIFLARSKLGLNILDTVIVFALQTGKVTSEEVAVKMQLPIGDVKNVVAVNYPRLETIQNSRAE